MAQTHHYQPDETARVAVESARPCVDCAMPKANRVHKTKADPVRTLPPTSPEARQRDAAILGEHEEEEE